MSPSLPRYPGWTPQFSLRQLFLLTTATCLWLSAMQMAPHCAFVLLALAMATFVTRLHWNLRRQMLGFALSFDDRLALASLATMSVMAWLILYIASVGPAAALAAHCRQMPYCVHALGVIYSPVTCLHDHTPLRAALDAYVRQFGAR